MNKNKILADEALNLIGTDIEILKSINIHHFGYREFLEDGSSIGFCTHHNWSHLQNKPYIIDDMSNHYKRELTELGNSKIKYLVRCGEARHESYYLNTLNNWQLWNSLIIYKREYNKISGYYFISPNKDLRIINSYMNNLPFVERVTSIIKPKIQKLLTNCGKDFYDQLFNVYEAKSILEGKNPISVTNTINNCKNFTGKENHIIWLLVQKYSNKKIAKVLNVSHRTVEWHLLNIKRKTETNNRRDLIEFLLTS